MEDSRNYLSEDDVKLIVKRTDNSFNKILNYDVLNLNDKMLGFMADYYKLKVEIQVNNEVRTLNYFIKAISTTNEAKAEMMLSMNLFEQELNYYEIIVLELQNPDIRSWSPKFITALKDAVVYEDLDARHYRVRNKFHTFDKQHTFQALQALARFHGSTLTYEEKKRKELKTWSLHDEFGKYFQKGGYTMTHQWYVQCMDATLGAIKTHSKYKNNIQILDNIESRWRKAWESNLELGEPSSEYRNVIAHRDLWNNNIMFHYCDDHQMIPDDCIFVDFQATGCQPPAGDVMILLHANLDADYREANIDLFLSYYYQELKSIFEGQGLLLENVMSYQKFLESAEKYRQWGLFVCACLMPTIWVNDKLIAEIFCDTEKYKDILTNNKCAYVNQMMENDDGFKKKIIPIYEEIIERYFLR